jgi:Spy/CpxP family protein refolding chaperone
MTHLFASSDEYKQSNTHIYKNLDYLNLNPAQEEEIKTILIKAKKKFSKYYEKKEKIDKQLQKLIQKEQFDEEEYEDIAEELIEEAIELEAKIFKHIHRVLTPKQRQQFSYHLKEWKIE